MTPPIKSSTWIVPLAFAGLVALFGWWGTGRLRQTMEGQLKAELATTLEANVTALEIWMGTEERLATALAEEPTTRDLALKVLQHAEVAANDTRSPSSSPELEELTRHLRPRLSKLGYQIAHLVSTNYLTLTTPQRGRMRSWSAVYEEHLDKFAELFTTGKPVIITPFRPKRPRFEGPPNFFRPPREPDSSRPPQPPPGDRAPGDPPPPGGRSRFGDGTLMQVTIDLRVKGPDEKQRAADEMLVFGEASDAMGGKAVLRLRTPAGYSLTADSAVTATCKVLEGRTAPGAYTPSMAFGARFVLGLEGVTLIG